MDIRNAKLPSNDLLNKCVLPYFIPIRADAESDKPSISIAIIAIFS